MRCSNVKLTRRERYLCLAASGIVIVVNMFFLANFYTQHTASTRNPVQKLSTQTLTTFPPMRWLVFPLSSGTKDNMVFGKSIAFEYHTEVVGSSELAGGDFSSQHILASRNGSEWQECNRDLFGGLAKCRQAYGGKDELVAYMADIHVPLNFGRDTSGNRLNTHVDYTAGNVTCTWSFVNVNIGTEDLLELGGMYDCQNITPKGLVSENLLESHVKVAGPEILPSSDWPRLALCQPQFFQVYGEFKSEIRNTSKISQHMGFKYCNESLPRAFVVPYAPGKTDSSFNKTGFLDCMITKRVLLVPFSSWDPVCLELTYPNGAFLSAVDDIVVSSERWTYDAHNVDVINLKATASPRNPRHENMNMNDLPDAIGVKVVFQQNHVEMYVGFTALNALSCWLAIASHTFAAFGIVFTTSISVPRHFFLGRYRDLFTWKTCEDQAVCSDRLV